jgi:signal transduction histidine kinase/HD-like signal output (HDOD) protein
MKVNSHQFFDRIETSRNLPSLPHILLKLIEVCNREDSTVKDMSQIINKDSSLSAKVMKMINSAYYMLPNRVTNIDRALLLLGIDAIKNIAISTSVYQAFSRAKDHSLFNLKVFWSHSLMCATLAKLIAKKTLYTSPDEAFLSGLLHDIGKLVLWVNFTKEYACILESSKDQSDLILAGEARLGATHCEVGAWLINRWNLQSFIADAVLYHHESVDRIQNALPLVKIIYGANILCPEVNTEKDVKLKVTQDILGLAGSEVEEIALQAQGEVSEIAKSLGIEIEPVDVSVKAVSDKDHKKQEELILEVKDISLLQGTLQSLLEAYNEDSILTVVQQGLQVIFDVKHVLFFLYDSERDALAGKGFDKQNDLINEVAIPFQKGNSLLVKSLRQGTPLDSFRDAIKANLAIVDEQIIRLIGKDGILCLPMTAHKQYVGVIVIGMNEARLSHLSERIKLLTMFTKQAALALHANYLRQNQARLIQSQRLTASSTIARKVVHEVNTPLSIVKNYLKILARKFAVENLGQEEIRVINEEIDRVALMLRKLSDFSEPKVQPTDPLDINALLSDVIKILQESLLLRPNIDVRLNLEPLLPTVITDKNSLKQVFINLIKNSIEALPQGGNLYISTRHASNNLGDKVLQDMGGNLGYVEITIRDDGPGIPDTLKSRLFEPFISSKGEGHAGLGLSIVYNIVKELKGTITCKSDSKKGTSFKIVLPIAQTHES